MDLNMHLRIDEDLNREDPRGSCAEVCRMMLLLRQIKSVWHSPTMQAQFCVKRCKKDSKIGGRFFASSRRKHPLFLGHFFLLFRNFRNTHTGFDRMMKPALLPVHENNMECGHQQQPETDRSILEMLDLDYLVATSDMIIMQRRCWFRWKNANI